MNIRSKGSFQRGGWLFLFLAAALICAYFLFRGSPPPRLFANSDKFFHFGGFFILMVAGYATFRSHRFLLGGVLSVVIALAVGAEFLHGSHLLPERSFDLMDLSANLAGCGIGGILVLALNRYG